MTTSIGCSVAFTIILGVVKQLFVDQRASPPVTIHNRFSLNALDFLVPLINYLSTIFTQ